MLIRDDCITPFQAAGLIHGLTVKPDLTLYTPMWAVLESIEQEFGLKLHKSCDEIRGEGDQFGYMPITIPGTETYVWRNSSGGGGAS